jgi:hypothetical protein
MPPSYRRRLNILFIFNSILIRKPFLSILYVCRGLIKYSLILDRRSSKYGEYLKAESARFRLVSRLDAHLDIKSTLCRSIKRSTYNLPGSLLAISLAKFRIICRVEGSPR